MRRLPSRIDFGVAILNVRQLSVKDMRLEADCDEYDPTPDGLWDSEQDTIFMLRRLSQRKKREVLAHELIHAAVDNEYWNKHGI